MRSTLSRQFHLASRPEGWPTLDNFVLAEVELPSLKAGQVLVRNSFLSVDPYMRGRMRGAASYATAYELGRPMSGGAVGTVEASESDRFNVGDVVLHTEGWRDLALVDANSLSRVDASISSPAAWLGVLGMTGLTAFVGLHDIAHMVPGDTVFISAAAGAVGLVAGQLARIAGAGRVIGSTGSEEKAAILVERYGFDVAIDYRRQNLAVTLAESAPDGVNLYFDNVGGDHLEAALANMAVSGRVALCGFISQYNLAEEADGPRNLGLAIARRLTLRGYIIGDHLARRSDYLPIATAALADGRLIGQDTVVDGLEHAPQAFLDMLAGRNIGKMVVKISE